MYSPLKLVTGYLIMKVCWTLNHIGCLMYSPLKLVTGYLIMKVCWTFILIPINYSEWKLIRETLHDISFVFTLSNN